MEIKVLPESNFPILEGGSLYITSSIDDRKIRFAIWPKGTKGLIIFFNGRNEYIEKYNEAYKKFQNLGYAVVTLDWRGQGLSDRAKNLDHLYTHIRYAVGRVIDDKDFSYLNSAEKVTAEINKGWDLVSLAAA